MRGEKGAPVVTFLALMAVFVGVLYFVGEKLWLQDGAFTTMSASIDKILIKLSQ
jgi:hypothetical protein